MPGTIPILSMPELSVRSITRKELALLRFEFTVNMEIENKNSFDMHIDKFQYDFSVNDHVWASGLFANPPVIRAKSRTALPLSVVLTTLPVIQSIRDIIDKGMVANYSLSGDLILSSSIPGLPPLDRPLYISGTTRL